MKKILKRIGLGFLALIVLLGAGFYVYTLDYSKAQDVALAAYAQSTQQSSSIHAFLSEGATVGIIFYPGGKVEDKAYSKLCLELSEQGISVFLVKMPFNLAVFDIDAANRVRKANPQITSWFMAGHSLGGAMAYSHYSSHPEEYEGIILLAAYPLDHKDLPYLILKGSNDTVLDASKLEGFDYVSIQGGNHAQFGNYGLQKGDGTATITPYEQRAFTIEAIRSFILNTLNP
ncbi:MAG: hypothetical protein HGB31_06625 [Erysipelotrichaceae bacterium]|nr:hypothetical protein [Erysipelotrichaceae bacterium]